WFTNLYPLKLTAYESIADTIIASKETLREVPDKGIGFAAFNCQQLQECLPTISFNYLGQLDSGDTQAQLWQLNPDDCGQTIHPDNHSGLHLNIFGAVHNAQLQFTLESQLMPSQTATFCQAFETALVAVVNQAVFMAKVGGEQTASDYPLDNFTTAHLNTLRQRYDIEAIFAATSLQQGFVSHHLSQPDDDAYRMQMQIDYHHDLDIERYQQAWLLASLKYPILRTAFDWHGGDGNAIVQVISKGASIGELHFNCVDLSEESPQQQSQTISQLQQAERAKPFDLSQPGLLRFTVVKRGPSFYSLIKTEHHSISDGWSGPLLMAKVHQYYDQLVAGITPQENPDSAYIEAQHYYRQQQGEVEQYWAKARQKWSGANDINLLLSQPLDLSQSHRLQRPASGQMVIAGDLYQQLKTTCQGLGVTLNVAVQFAWHKLLHCYSQDQQTIVGTTVSGRDIGVSGIESSVGLYINTLPLLMDWSAPKDNIASQLQALQQDIAALNRYCAVNLAQLQSHNQYNNHGERLFHTLLVFENYPQLAGQPQGLAANATIVNTIEKNDYPLSVTAYQQPDHLALNLHFDLSWLSKPHGERLLRQLRQILAHVADSPQSVHQAISLVDPQERALLHSRVKRDERPWPQTLTLVQLFSQQVQLTPDNSALIYQGERISYAQLDKRSNQLARVIQSQYLAVNQQPISADTLIALYQDCGPALVISILAVLKTGGAYVPISTDYPRQR
ncbi:MAG: condensation domain-containing protein, partial [Psychrosphaera sp.]|nr:condensation domain-containing protein [Psychrosphaera sp.]